MGFETNVMTGTALLDFAEGVRGWEKRDCYAQLEQYLYGGRSDRVCLLYGLRRTGKTTLLRQAILNMTEEQRQKAAYLKAKRTDTMASVNRDIKALQERGFRYVFLDEATLMQDFVDSAALFSDVYASCGMKLVLSGTDSLGFWLAEREELYDRAVMLHTTFIPYREFCRLLHTGTSVTAGRCGPGSWISPQKASTRRKRPSGTMKARGSILTRRSAEISSTPCPVMRTAGISATCGRSMTRGS